MSLDASLGRLEEQLDSWKATLERDDAEAFGEVAALVALFRELRTAQGQHLAAIKMGLASAWREFNQ